MSLVFGDSFNHYNSGNLAEKYDSIGDNGIVINASLARTGTRCLQIISGSLGPYKILGGHFAQLIVQAGFHLDSDGAAHQTGIFQFSINGVGYNIEIRVNGDSTFSVWRGNPGDAGSVELIRTPYRAAVWNAWNYVQCQCVFDDTNGSVVLNVNGRVIANLSGIRTTGQLGTHFTDAVRLLGASGNGSLSLLADFAVINPLVAPNTTFLNQCKVYATVPNANASPVNWTPLAGSNFQNVDTIPPNEATFNSSATIGQIDQYSHPLGSVPGAAAIAAIQHVMDLEIDSGARTVASDIAGTVGAGFPLTTSFVMYSTPSDTAPAFPLSAGPKVTA